MQRKATAIVLLMGLTAFVVIASYAEQHDHAAQSTQSTSSASAQKDKDIFCSTMKTGQLCTHGTAANLGLSGQKREQWIAFARKYNKAVDAATLQLFKDAEGVMMPAQLAMASNNPSTFIENISSYG